MQPLVLTNKNREEKKIGGGRWRGEAVCRIGINQVFFVVAYFNV
jgi:hypothetical protein